VKTESLGTSTIYQGKIKRPARGPWAPLLLLLLSLLAAHFLNLFMQWTIMRNALTQKPSFHTPEYSFLGFRLFNQEKIDAARRLPNASPAGRIFVFFDSLHPAVFMVWNNGGEGDFFDLGPVLAAVPVGASLVTIYPAAVFVLRHDEETVVKNYGGSILGRAWAGFLGRKPNAGEKIPGQMSGSFVAKQPETSPFLKIPYLVYFYLPLAAIILLVASSGAAMAAAFFYYAGMFFLFDYQNLFVSVPFAWAFRAVNVELPDPWVSVLAAAIAAFFLGCSVYGLWHWKNREMPPSSKWIAWFFVLLPFFLFF
jgi:hypothetical protein